MLRLLGTSFKDSRFEAGEAKTIGCLARSEVALLLSIMGDDSWVKNAQPMALNAGPSCFPSIPHIEPQTMYPSASHAPNARICTPSTRFEAKTVYLTDSIGVN
jgi:hypothetical protein